MQKRRQRPVTFEKAPGNRQVTTGAFFIFNVLACQQEAGMPER